MLTASVHWYASAGFWAPAAGVLAVVAMGVLAALVAWRAANPKRQLEYAWTVTQLLASESLGTTEHGSVTVAYKDMPIADPYVVTLTVRSLGRKDIRTSDFDGGRSLVFDLGTEVKAVLDSKVRSGVLHVLTPGSAELAPALIRRGNVLRLTALTEGPATVTCRSPIADVEVKEHDEPYHAVQLRLQASSTIRGAVLLVILWLASTVATYMALLVGRKSDLAMAISLGFYVLLWPVGIVVLMSRLSRAVEKRENETAADW